MAEARLEALADSVAVRSVAEVLAEAGNGLDEQLLKDIGRTQGAYHGIVQAIIRKRYVQYFAALSAVELEKMQIL